MEEINNVATTSLVVTQYYIRQEVSLSDEYRNLMLSLLP